MVVASSNSGLGNRLKAIVSALRLDSEARVYWPKTPGVLNCDYHELFSDNREIVPPWQEGYRMYSSWRLAVLPQDNLPKGFSQVVTGYPRKFSETDINGCYIDFEYERIPQYTKDSYVAIFKTLNFSSAVQSGVNEFSKQFNKNTVSVHIRSWRDSALRKQHLFRIQKYIIVMESLLEKNSERNFYVTADDDLPIKILQNKFTDKILVFPRSEGRLKSRYSVKGAIDDLIELLLLSSNTILIGTHISSFSEVAWWLSQCQSRPIIV